jgi:hypothetical protein
VSSKTKAPNRTDVETLKRLLTRSIAVADKLRRADVVDDLLRAKQRLISKG